MSPQAQGSMGRLVVAEELTFKSPPELVIEDCEDAWNEQTITNVTSSLDQTAGNFKVGTGSAKFDVAAAASTGILGSEAISSLNVASFLFVGLWIKSSVALAANDLQLLLDDTANCPSPVETLNIPAVAANTWTWVKLPFANPASDTAIISVGIKMVVDRGAFVLNIDDVRALNDGIFVPFVSESVRMSRNLNVSNTQRSTRNPNAPSRGSIDVAGDISIELNPFIGRLFKHLMGSYVRTGAGPYTHTFTIGNLPTGLQLEKQFSDISSFFRYNGCKIGSFKADLKDQGAVTGSFTLMGSKETVGTLPHDGSPTDQGFAPFDAFAATINQGGSALAVASALNFTYDNGLDGSTFVLGGAGIRYSINAGIAKVSGQLTALFADLALYNLALNNTETTLQLVLSRGTGAGTAGNETLTFNFNEVILKPQAPVISGPKGVLVELPFEAYYDNDAGASAMSIVLVNAQALL